MLPLPDVKCDRNDVWDAGGGNCGNSSDYMAGPPRPMSFNRLSIVEFNPQRYIFLLSLLKLVALVEIETNSKCSSKAL